MIWNAFLLALREIRRNLLRSGLTTLGIVIGIAAVIIMVTVGNGVTAKVSEQISSLGSNLLMVRAGGRGLSGTAAKPFSLDDAQAISSQISHLNAVAPSASKSTTAVFGNKNWSTTVTGMTDPYFIAGNWVVREGRQFNESELRSGSMSCIIGNTVWKELFEEKNALGGKLRLNSLSCTVVGILKAKGQAFGRDQDDTILIPLRAFQRRIAGNQDVGMISVSVTEGFATEKTQKQVQQLLRDRRHIAGNEEDDFFILDTKEIAATLTGTTKILTSLLGAVAAVSLLVGGIGIMNIGGFFGIVLAIVASIIIARAIEVPFILDLGIILVACVFSAAVGIVFGYFPARRAAQLDPIEALRHE
ncbi:MAG: ABC transporter permease [Methylococcaceae bacterium]|nr:ABC transporter permease [Methylococcaceae bacterium]